MLVLCAAALMSLASCGDSSSKSSADSLSSISGVSVSKKTDSSSVSESSAPQDESVDLSFVLPSKAVSPDLSKSDPSDDNIKFIFDAKGRVESYKYKADQKEFMVTYSYKEDQKKVDIYSFSGDIIVGEEHFELPDFDDSQGFIEKDGYFFNKYKF